MSQESTEKMAKKLMEIKGEIRGFGLNQDGEFVLKEKGRLGLEKVEHQLKEWGYPIEYEKIKKMDFFPVGLKVLSLLAIKKVFNFDDVGVRKVCAFQPKTPLVAKLFLRYCYSITKAIEKTQKMWERYFTVGRLFCVEYHLKKKYVILRIEDLNLHPVFCCCMEGYLISLTEMIVKSSKITCQETKCSFQGDKYHEYLIKWE